MAYRRDICEGRQALALRLRLLAAHKGFTDGATLKEGVKAGDIVQWLKADFHLGHGHAMAIYALLKGAKSEDSH